MDQTTPLVPGQFVPDLSLPLSGGGSWRLSDQKPRHFTLLAFYRGAHCAVCRDYLGRLQSLFAAFRARGVTPIAISMDTAERACSAEARWRLEDLCVAFGLSLPLARQWGLRVSRGRGLSSLRIKEPPIFVEPALFLVRPDRTLHFASVPSMRSARPCLKDLLNELVRGAPGAEPPVDVSWTEVTRNAEDTALGTARR